MSRFLQWIAIVALIFGLSAGVSADDQNAQKAVLVTGASSGIGLKITEHLSANGYYVYASARKAADLERLDGMDNVSSVRLDVTVQDDIDAAVVAPSLSDRAPGMQPTRASAAVIA
jgi:NADPH:quinone reductase-like Zn-dependent oxidoreductase